MTDTHRHSLSHTHIQQHHQHNNNTLQHTPTHTALFFFCSSLSSLSSPFLCLSSCCSSRFFVSPRVGPSLPVVPRMSCLVLSWLSFQRLWTCTHKSNRHTEAETKKTLPTTTPMKTHKQARTHNVNIRWKRKHHQRKHTQERTHTHTHSHTNNTVKLHRLKRTN